MRSAKKPRRGTGPPHCLTWRVAGDLIRLSPHYNSFSLQYCVIGLIGRNSYVILDPIHDGHGQASITECGQEFEFVEQKLEFPLANTGGHRALEN